MSSIRQRESCWVFYPGPKGFDQTRLKAPMPCLTDAWEGQTAQVIGLEYPRKMNPNFNVLNWSNDQESQFMTLLIDAAKQKKLLNKT